MELLKVVLVNFLNPYAHTNEHLSVGIVLLPLVHHTICNVSNSV